MTLTLNDVNSFVFTLLQSVCDFMLKPPINWFVVIAIISAIFTLVLKIINLRKED